ncbi:N-acetylmuramoyl-L-alanine amidase family protein [Silvimonas amylolytica]|uniref:N-acetylmuramoyl-L-alanine amidase n=1 Tax=Silvimonas amylolytica TaxID=449663 RepID=A0ABQ2PM52_9NEIS|nr:N-acetylmuramoyl-L-alanine amidase [Silvimonas amylolytica]GGP26690.1 N-acetylmuramoyl-L-alanine amidase [Silvimonas amylolytica]
MNKVLATLALVCVVVAPAVMAKPRPLTVAVDVGHYLDAPGATSAYGVTEFTYNSKLADVLTERLLAAGYTVRLIGDDGQSKDLQKRAKAAEGADVFVSLHHDSTQPQFIQEWEVDGQKQKYSDRTHGFSVFVSKINPQYTKSLACAKALGAQMKTQGFEVNVSHAEKIEGESREWVDQADGVYAADFVVLRATTMPALLLESGVIVNRDEAKTLDQITTRNKIADAVIAAIGDCMKK